MSVDDIESRIALLSEQAFGLARSVVQSSELPSALTRRVADARDELAALGSRADPAIVSEISLDLRYASMPRAWCAGALAVISRAWDAPR